MKFIKGRLGVGNRQAYLLAVTFLLLLTSIISAICFTYFGWLQSTIRAESNGYLGELCKKAGNSVEKTIDTYFGILDTTESLMQHVQMDSVQQMQQAIRQQRERWDFRDLLLIDSEGKAFDETGSQFSLPDADFLRETIVNRKRVISPAQIIGDAECILFTIPVQNIWVMETEICALGISYRLDSFDDILSTALFNGEAYTNIINTDGTIAIPSSAPSAVSLGYNFLYFLQKEDPQRQAEIDKMKCNMQNGVAGQLECTFAGEANYITYYPLDTLDWSLVTIVPVAVANAKTQQLLTISLWFCAFVILLVTVLVLMLAIVFFKNKRGLEKLAFVDKVTGGYTLQCFSILTSELLNDAAPGSYALVYTNFQRFRIFNEQYGRPVGNLLLKSVYELTQKDLSDKECICRILDDHFCVLVNFQDIAELTTRFEHWQKVVAAFTMEKGMETLVPQFGVYLIQNRDMPLESMIDFARFTLNKITKIQTQSFQYAIYDENAHLKELREKQLEGMMEKSLNNGEFVVYLQPKYLLEPERIGGAEALIRWQQPDGMIFPDEFIPLFEKNGFIVNIDLFVFEEVCKTVQRWVDAGIELVPVSINCSRRHFQKENFLQEYQKIVQRYHIPTRYLELELTESIVYEDTDRLVEIVKEIHAMGFQCSIDDFGSGYSSLNLIKDIPADTLKIDKIFFRANDENAKRGESVVESIINMAKSLSMETVAEGVEHREQVELLKALNCGFVQGYVFAKPMPIADFERLAFSAAVPSELPEQQTAHFA